MTRTAVQTQIQVEDPYQRFQNKIRGPGGTSRQMQRLLEQERSKWQREQEKSRWRQHLREMNERYERGEINPPGLPPYSGTTPSSASPSPMESPKPLKSNPMREPTIKVTPNILSVFDNDTEEVLDFIDSLNEQELRIMERNQDNPKVIKRLKLRVRNDIEETAKDLAMDE